MSSVPVSYRGLFLLALGALVAALPLGVAVRVAGTLCAAAGLWLLQPRAGRKSKQRFALATSLVATWALVLLLGLSSIGVAALLAAFLVGGGALTEIATLNAWSYATRAWKTCSWAGAVVYGVGLLVGLSELILGAGDLLADSLLGRAGPACLALPALAVIRACALSARDQAQSAQVPVPATARWGASRSAMALLALVLLLPLWLLLPLVSHHHSTPSFLAASRQPASWSAPTFAPAALVDVTTQPWKDGRPVGFRSDEDPPFPPGLQTVGHRIALTVHHGGQRLADVELNLLATLDQKTGRLRGARTRAARLEATPGFRVDALARVDLDQPPRGSLKDRNLIVRVPFVVWVAVLSGNGPSVLTTQRLRGLNLGLAPEDVPGVAPSALPEWVPNLEGLRPLLTRGNARPESGLRYVLAVEGALELRQASVAAAQVRSNAQFRANTLEYDYTVELTERVDVQDAERTVNETRRRRWVQHRRWRGRAW